MGSRTRPKPGNRPTKAGAPRAAAPRRARRARARASGARERLIEAASEVLREQGYRAAPLDEILRRSGVAKSNLYYHFAGKLELACATVDQWLDSPFVRSLRDALLDPARRGLARLEAFVNVFQEASCSGPAGCAFGMLAAEDDLPESLRARVDRAFRALEDGIELAVRAGIRDGSIRADANPGHVSRALLAAVEGAGLMARCRRDPERIGGACRALFDLVAPAKPSDRVSS